MSSLRPWKIEARRSRLTTRVFEVEEIEARPQDAASTHVFQRLLAPDWVNIIPITHDGQVVFVRQFRHGAQVETLEIPGGMVDPGEEAGAAGLRELREETGYAGRVARQVGVVNPNPALFANRCFTFVTEGVTRVGAIENEGAEATRVELHPLADVPRLMREGVIDHALVIAAFHWLSIEARVG